MDCGIPSGPRGSTCGKLQLEFDRAPPGDRINTSRKKLPLHPGHPERICWGCDKYCPAGNMACGNGTDRAQHPAEIFGDDWLHLGLDAADDGSLGVTADVVADDTGPRSQPR